MADRQSRRDLPPQISAQRRQRLTIGQPVQGLQNQNRRHDVYRDRRAPPTRRKQILEHQRREQHPTLIGQQPEHRPRLDQMPRNRFGIQQLTLINWTTLHKHIVPALKFNGRDNTLCSAGS